MTCAYLKLSLVLILAFLIRYALHFCGEKSSHLELLHNIEAINDPEGCLARGARLRLSKANMWALELIPGISDTLADNILTRRKYVRHVAPHLTEGTRHTALEVVHGLGPKSARKLGKYIEID